MNCERGAIALRDHGTVELHIDLNSDKVKRDHWKLNIMLLKDKSFSDTLSKDLKFSLKLILAPKKKYPLFGKHLRHL